MDLSRFPECDLTKINEVRALAEYSQDRPAAGYPFPLNRLTYWDHWHLFQRSIERSPQRSPRGERGPSWRSYGAPGASIRRGSRTLRGLFHASIGVPYGGDCQWWFYVKQSQFCVCGRGDSQGESEVRLALRDVMERKLDLARECALDPRALRDLRDLRDQERALRSELAEIVWKTRSDARP